MATLNPNDEYVTLINTFTVDPSRTDELLQELVAATNDGMRQRAGFISANLHVSRDGRHIANYAQWRNQEDLDAMMADPAARDHMKHAASIAQSFDPIYYVLRESVSTDK